MSLASTLRASLAAATCSSRPGATRPTSSTWPTATAASTAASNSSLANVPTLSDQLMTSPLPRDIRFARAPAALAASAPKVALGALLHGAGPALGIRHLRHQPVDLVGDRLSPLSARGH